MGSQVSLTAMSVRAGRGGDEVLVSQAVWDYLSAAGQPWLAEFQSGHGLSAGVVRRTEMGGCCTVKLRSPGGEGLGSGPAPVSPAARRAFMDLCRSARKEMNRKEGAPKRKRSLMPCLGGGEADGEGSLLPPQPRRSQRQQLRCRKAADLGGGLCAPAPPPRDLLPRREAELGGAGGGAGGGALPAEVEDGGVCSICMGEMVERTTLDRCGHAFCRTCLDRAFQVKRACPVCRLVYGQLIGNQPANGTMMVERDPDLELPGHEGYGCIFIIYSFPPGTQSQEHLNPGVRYPGTDRVAYLPDSPEGNRVLGLLRRAFEQRLIFTIGTSMTTGMSNVITWNDIHHKTSVWGGPRCFGYPDPTYLVRVTEELREKGITAD